MAKKNDPSIPAKKSTPRHLIGPDGKRYKGTQRSYQGSLNREGLHTGKKVSRLYPRDMRTNPRGIEMVGAIENPDTPTENWLGESLKKWTKQMQDVKYVLSMDKLSQPHQALVMAVVRAYNGDPEKTANLLSSNGLHVTPEFVEAMSRTKGFADYLTIHGTYGRITATPEMLKSFWTEVMLDEKASMRDRSNAAENLAKSQGMFKVEVNHSGNVTTTIDNVLDQLNSNRDKAAQIGHDGPDTEGYEEPDDVIDADFTAVETPPEPDKEDAPWQ